MTRIHKEQIKKGVTFTLRDNDNRFTLKVTDVKTVITVQGSISTGAKSPLVRVTMGIKEFQQFLEENNATRMR